MERRVGCEKGLNAIEVLGTDGLEQLTRSLKQLYVMLQLRPVGKAVVASDLELGVGQGGSCASTDKILGLVTKMSEIRAFGKFHAKSFPSARCPHVRAKGVSQKTTLARLGFYPFRGPAASLTLVR
jgi:hypothetical protein